MSKPSGPVKDLTNILDQMQSLEISGEEASAGNGMLTLDPIDSVEDFPAISDGDLLPPMQDEPHLDLGSSGQIVDSALESDFALTPSGGHDPIMLDSGDAGFTLAPEPEVGGLSPLGEALAAGTGDGVIDGHGGGLSAGNATEARDADGAIRFDDFVPSEPAAREASGFTAAVGPAVTESVDFEMAPEPMGGADAQGEASRVSDFSPAPSSAPDPDFAPTPDFAPADDFAPNADAPDPQSARVPEPQARASAPESRGDSPKRSGMNQVKDFADAVAIGKPLVQAAFPFSVMIRGHLNAHEKDKLLDLLSRENLGIREVDLDPQFAAGRVLIPRISEYAAVLLVQTLRSSRAGIIMGPSDSIFATDDTRGDSTSPSESRRVHLQEYSSDSQHPAEDMPLSTLNELPKREPYSVIDVVSASAALKSSAVEANTTSDYQELLENLQREIKYKAFRRGADAIVNFKSQLQSLNGPTHYRVSVTGTAVKRGSGRT